MYTQLKHITCSFLWGSDTPGIEVLSRQGFRQDASPRGVSLTSASFAAMWLNVIALSAKTTNRNLMDFLSALKKISHYRSCIINAMWWWQTFHELRYLVLKCHMDITLYQRYLTLIVMFNELLLSVEKPAYHASQVWSQWDQGDKDKICEENKDNSKLQIWRNIENENIIWQK